MPSNLWNGQNDWIADELVRPLKDRQGQVKYYPDSGFSGNDSFSFRVVDKRGMASEPATVTIEVTPRGDMDQYIPDDDPPYETRDSKFPSVSVIDGKVSKHGLADIEIARRQRQGLPTDGIDRDNYGPIIGTQARSEAVERGAEYGQGLGTHR